MKLLVATTVAPWKQGPGTTAWLHHAEEMDAGRPIGMDPLEFFCAVEVDGRGIAPHRTLMSRLDNLASKGHAVKTWQFSIDDGAAEYESGNRLFRICTGRNAAHEYAMVNGCDAILFVDTDIRPPTDIITLLTVIDHPIVGGNVSAYGLTGPLVTVREVGKKFAVYEGDKKVLVLTERPFPPGVEVRSHWNTAGLLLVRRPVFINVAWHYNLDLGSTDDPTFQRDARLLGYGETWVRHDIPIATHVDPLVAVEARDLDRRYYR